MKIEKFIMQEYQEKIDRLQAELDKLQRELKDFDPKTGLRKLQTRKGSGIYVTGEDGELLKKRRKNEQSTKTSRD